MSILTCERTTSKIATASAAKPFGMISSIPAIYCRRSSTASSGPTSEKIKAARVALPICFNAHGISHPGPALSTAVHHLKLLSGEEAGWSTGSSPKMWEGRNDEVVAEDVHRAALLALSHRWRRGPFEQRV